MSFTSDSISSILILKESLEKQSIRQGKKYQFEMIITEESVAYLVKDVWDRIMNQVKILRDSRLVGALKVCI